MKKIFSALIFCLVINTSFAAMLEDVTVLDVKHDKGNFELKLQAKHGPKDSYFIVDVVSTDKEAFNKIALVMKKMKKGADFKLDMNIPSFSVSPSGSYYRSESVTFKGNIGSESLMIDSQN